VSDNTSPPTLGEALYGPSGPASEPQFAKGIEAGKAAPPQQWRGESLDRLPAAADPRSVVPNQPAPVPTASPSEPKSLGESLYGKPGATPEAVAANTFTLPEGMEPHPELIGEFGTAAKELRLDKAGADRLLALHAKATQAATDHQAGEWRKQSEAAFSADELADIRSSFTEAIGTDADAQTFRQLLSSSGLGNHPAVIRVIGRLVRR